MLPINSVDGTAEQKEKIIELPKETSDKCEFDSYDQSLHIQLVSYHISFLVYVHVHVIRKLNSR